VNFFDSLGCFSLVLIVLPIWALIEIRRDRRRLEQLQDALTELQARITVFERLLSDVRRERREGLGAAAGAKPVEPSAPTPPSQPIPEARAAAVSAAPPPLAAPPPDRPPIPALRDDVLSPPPSLALPPPPPRPSEPFDWESLISVRVFAWLGGGALFLGAALFLQYSIQHGLISPPMRVAIGLVVGSAALLWGDSLRARAMWAGQATSGAGVGVLYASLYAAHTLYGLLPTTPTFLAMAAVTFVAGLVAVRRSAHVLAMIGLVGGFMTPFLLATNEDHPIGLLAYVVLLDIGVLAVARKRSWVSLQLFGLAGSVILYAGWASRHLDGAKLPYALGAAVLLGALFVFGALREPRGPRELVVATPLLGALAPFALALAVSEPSSFSVSPVVLVVYLLILIVQAAWIARDLQVAALMPIAAGTAVFALILRPATDLFPDRRALCLTLFALVPAALFAVWIWNRDSTQSIAYRVAMVIGLVGCLPILIHVLDVEPHGEPIAPLWLYVAAHAAGLVAVGALLRAGPWILGAQGLLFAALLALTSRFQSARLPEFLPWIVIPIVVFWILPFVASRFRADHLAWVSAGLAPIVHFAVLYFLAKPTWGTNWLGLISVVLGALAFVALRRALTMSAGDPQERRFTAALFGGVTLLFLTAAIPILLDNEWITVAWALEAAALAWLSTRIRVGALVKASGVLAVAAFARLVMNPELWRYHPRGATPIFNWYLYTFGIPAIAFLAAAHWVRDSPVARELRMTEGLQLLAGITLFVLLNVEIADFFSTGSTLVFRLTGGGLAQDMTYSLAWGLFALALLFIGIARSSKMTRAAALAVLLLTIAKVFLHDLWDLGALYRVGSIVGLAVALLAVSFLTQRFVFSKERS